MNKTGQKNKDNHYLRTETQCFYLTPQKSKYEKKFGTTNKLPRMFFVFTVKIWSET